MQLSKATFGKYIAYMVDIEVYIQYPKLRFAVFDALRPIEVQSFMVNFVIREECLSKNINPDVGNLLWILTPRCSPSGKQRRVRVHI